MKLESLETTRVNVKDLTLTTAPPQPELKSRAQFYLLKGSNLYARKDNLWLGTEADVEAHMAPNQLLGVLTESYFNRPSAESFYDRLKMMPFWDEQNNRWVNYYQDNEGILTTDEDVVKSALLDTLCLFQFERKYDALEVFKKTKESPGYKKTKFWINDAGFYATDLQFLGLWAEHIINPKNTKANYQRLLDSPLRREDGLWFPALDSSLKVSDNEAVGHDMLFSRDQLLGTLALSLFDKESAKAQYEKLKETPHFFDRSDGRWLDYGMALTQARQGQGALVNTEDQLLDVIINYHLEQRPLVKKVAGFLPEMRRF